MIELELHQVDTTQECTESGFTVVEWLAGARVCGLTIAFVSDDIGILCQTKISITIDWNIKHTPTNIRK